MKISKVFNNNVVLSLDDGGQEVVLIGRGLGFQAKPGDDVDQARVERTFVPTGGQTPERVAAFLGEIPMEDIQLTEEILERARDVLGPYVSAHMLLPLADHLSFAMRRARDDVAIDYPLQWEVMALYPQEVAFSRSLIDLVERRTGVRLPDLEAIPFALHFVNARFGQDDLSKTMEMTEVFAAVLATVRARLGIALDEESLDVARFLTHLRYLFLRQERGALPGGDHQRLLDVVQMSHPREFGCAQEVKALLEQRFEWALNQNEVLYLALHIARLSASVG
jgi:beta-glucoside operon transcriptional antiterminator